MPDSSELLTKQVKRSRRRGPNTTSGCDTCKIRRKRCDQTRPACLRCSSTGRTCDFLSSNSAELDLQVSKGYASRRLLETLYKPPTITSTLGLLPLGNSIDAEHFDFFRLQCAKEFAGYFNADLWERLVVQAAHSEPFILHAILVISSLRRQMIPGPEKYLHYPKASEYSMKQYAIALQTLRKRLQDRTVDWRLVALGSLVFLAIEVLHDREQEALIHFQSGETILKSLSNKPTLLIKEVKEGQSVIPQLGSTQNAVSDEIITAFTRLSVEEELFIGVSSPNVIDIQALPIKFEGAADARYYLNSIVAATLSFARKYGAEELKTLPHKPLPANIAADFSLIQHNLHSWYHVFTKFLSSRKFPPVAGTEITELPFRPEILLINYYATSIKVATYFYTSELIYDDHIPQFAAIIDITSGIVARHGNTASPCLTVEITSESNLSRTVSPLSSRFSTVIPFPAPTRANQSRENEEGNSSFFFKISSSGMLTASLQRIVAQPLYYTARKCRDLDLRMKAIEELKKVGNNGIYTGRTVATVAEWVVKMEMGDELDGFVPEERRLKDVYFDFSRLKTSEEVRATRKRKDGTLEVLVGNLDMWS